MDPYEEFKRSMANAVDAFRKFDKFKTVRVISHMDADGISACAILIRLLNQENMKYSVSILNQLDIKNLNELAVEGYEQFIFTDVGSGQLKSIVEILKGKKIIILDHHSTHEVSIPDGITQINPNLFGIDGGKEISGAGVVYLFAKEARKENEELAHIAVIGAIGDVQEDDGFRTLNNEILEAAVRNKKIEVKRGLRFFGMETRPIHKVLEYSTDPYIPGVSGSESSAIQFLNQIGIYPKKKNSSDWKKFGDLSEDEFKKIVAAIILRRIDEDKPDDVLGNIYYLVEEKKESATKDAKEFSTLLNACGRMGKASLGIGACLGDKKTKMRAINNLNDYRKEIVNALKWYESNKENFIKDKRYIIINAKNSISSTIIGTLASMVSKSNEFQDGTYVMSMAYSEEHLKISLRISGRVKGIDLKEIMHEIVGKSAGEAGGHKYAAGAIVPIEKEEEFLSAANDVLSKKAMEEVVR